MAEAHTSRTPNEELASMVAEALAAAGLVPRTRLEELEQQLAAGRVTEQVWRLVIETALPAARPEERHGQRD